MARALWSGSISFGLVNVPVKLYNAVSSKDVHFHQLDEKTGKRIHNKKVAGSSNREVPSERIVKGYEISKSKYVTLTDEEIDAVEPERTHTINVEDFVAIDEVDPMHFTSAYWVTPDDAKGSKAAAKAYALLRDAMAKSEKVGVGRFVLRTKERLAILRPVEGALVVHSMLFPDELVAMKDIKGLPVHVKASPREVKMASQLIESLTVGWDPDRYRDTYREELLDVIERKAKGEEIVTDREEAPTAEVVDLMAALEASIEANRGRKRSTKHTRKRKSA